MSEIINGKELAKQIKERVARKTERYVREYGRPPHLVLILVGDDPSSEKYVAGKEADARKAGFEVSVYRCPVSTSEKGLIEIISWLNSNPEVDGILAQLPLPPHIREDRIIEAVSRYKDVDGFHPANVAALWQTLPGIRPCTPVGIMKMLDFAGVDLTGKHAVVVGRSNIVGLPISKMLLDANATVTHAHSRTADLGAVTRLADILVVAIGKPKFIKEDMVKEGAVVIDVGVNRDPATGKVCGDVDFEQVSEKATLISPVPGGVGPMTKAILLENTLQCYLDNIHKRNNIE